MTTAQDLNPDVDTRLFYDFHEVCSLLSLTAYQLKRAIANGSVPPPDLRISSRAIRWRASGFDAWLAGEGARNGR